ncbi:MAG TPA: trypsin-like peptidase domain-containing protein [Chloroflexota bacterium]
MNFNLGHIQGSTVARLVATAALAFAVGFGAQTAGVLSPGSHASVPTVAAQAAPSDQSFVSAIRQVSDQVKPAVVQITSSQQVPTLSNQVVPQQTGVGSGVIYDRAGYVLTNNHVVAGADKLTVALPDGRSFDGKVIGTDPQTDLAVVQIQGDNLPVAQLGDSSQLGVGEWLVAIGNALALPGGPTVTQGVVSALDRSVQEPADSQTGQAGPYLYDLIQTDAAINPGNSGGALVNLQGQVVGINTLVAGMAEPGVQAQGIGFAISINSAKPIAEQLVSTGRASHPFVGISYTAVTPNIARQLGLQDTKGIVVAQVVAGSPAAQAGIQRSDVLTRIDQQVITDESTLGKVLNSHKPGDQVTITVTRGGQSIDLHLTLAERPSGS